MIHAFRWRPDQWNLLAAGTIAGHIIECGAQCTGGNCQAGWQSIPDMANIGYPIVEAEPDGSFHVTKHPGTGGRVNTGVVKEQLLYELGDPRNYITPDCVADFTSIRISDAGPDRVRVHDIQGGPRPPSLKVSISYSWGYKAIGSLVYSWPDALEKRAPRTASSAAASTNWICASTKSTPNFSASTPATDPPPHPLPTRRKCNFASASVEWTAKPWTASPASSSPSY